MIRARIFVTAFAHADLACCWLSLVVTLFAWGLGLMIGTTAPYLFILSLAFLVISFSITEIVNVI
jgi:hypothetical protein